MSSQAQEALEEIRAEGLTRDEALDDWRGSAYVTGLDILFYDGSALVWVYDWHVQEPESSPARMTLDLGVPEKTVKALRDKLSFCDFELLTRAFERAAADERAENACRAFERKARLRRIAGVG